MNLIPRERNWFTWDEELSLPRRINFSTKVRTIQSSVAFSGLRLGNPYRGRRLAARSLPWALFDRPAGPERSARARQLTRTGQPEAYPTRAIHLAAGWQAWTIRSAVVREEMKPAWGVKVAAAALRK